VNIGRDELEMDDKELLETIMKQNKIEADREGFHMRILKRIKKRGVEGERPNRTAKEEGSIIIELDENKMRDNERKESEHRMEEVFSI